MLIAEPVESEHGDTPFPCFDWQQKFSGLGKIIGIKRYHHFLFKNSLLRLIAAKKCVGSVHETVAVLKTDVISMSSALPPVVPPPGLPSEWQPVQQHINVDMYMILPKTLFAPTPIFCWCM